MSDAAKQARKHLGDAGCFACHAAARHQGRSVFWFFAEERTVEVMNGVRAAFGWCPAHTRALLAHYGASTTLPLVYAEIVESALARLDARARCGERPGPCHFCMSRTQLIAFVIHTVLRGMADPSVGGAYRETGGLCCRHLLDALARARADEARVLIDVAAERLDRESGDGVPIELVASHDPDRARRRHVEQHSLELSEGEARFGATVLDTLLDDLTLAACPSCLAGVWVERRFLAWLWTEWERDPTPLVEEVADLCSAHLWDLLDSHAAAGAWAASVQGDRFRGELARLVTRIESLRPLPLLWRLPSLRCQPRLVADVLAPLFARPACRACRAHDVAERRQVDLLLAAYGDPAVARAYAGSPGLCLRHLLAVESASRWTTFRSLATARFEVLAWELRETCRKQSWSVRYEPKGDETTAWTRAPAALDGRVFLGGPPVPLW